MIFKSYLGYQPVEPSQDEINIFNTLKQQLADIDQQLSVAQSTLDAKKLQMMTIYNEKNITSPIIERLLKDPDWGGIHRDRYSQACRNRLLNDFKESISLKVLDENLKFITQADTDPDRFGNTDDGGRAIILHIKTELNNLRSSSKNYQQYLALKKETDELNESITAITTQQQKLKTENLKVQFIWEETLIKNVKAAIDAVPSQKTDEFSLGNSIKKYIDNYKGTYEDKSILDYCEPLFKRNKNETDQVIDHFRKIITAHDANRMMIKARQLEPLLHVDAPSPEPQSSTQNERMQPIHPVTATTLSNIQKACQEYITHLESFPKDPLAQKKKTIIEGVQQYIPEGTTNLNDFYAHLLTEANIKTLSTSRDDAFWKYVKVALRKMYRALWPDAPVTEGAKLLDKMGLYAKTKRVDWQRAEDAKPEDERYVDPNP